MNVPLRRILLSLLIATALPAAEEALRDADFVREITLCPIGAFAPAERRLVDIAFTIDADVLRVVDVTTTCRCTAPFLDDLSSLQRGPCHLPVEVTAGERAGDSVGGVVNIFLVTQAGPICRSLHLNGTIVDPLIWPTSSGSVLDLGVIATDDRLAPIPLRKGEHPTAWDAVVLAPEPDSSPLHLSLGKTSTGWNLEISRRSPAHIGTFSHILCFRFLRDGREVFTSDKKLRLTVLGAVRAVPTAALIGPVRAGTPWETSLRLVASEPGKPLPDISSLQVSTPGITAIRAGDRILLRPVPDEPAAAAGVLTIHFAEGTILSVPLIGTVIGTAR